MAGEQKQRERRRERRIGLIALVVGALLWAFLTGPIAQTMPASWQWPEWMAARTLRMPMWQGGMRLMVANHAALNACLAQAAKAKKAVRCSIEVATGE